MSRQTKFKIGDKVRRTSHLANGTHTYGTVDTVVGIKIEQISGVERYKKMHLEETQMIDREQADR